MFGRIVLLFFTFLFHFCLIAQTTDLFISEYVEGSGSEKYVEIYNGTGASVNLSDYRLRLYSNGSPTPTSDVLLSGTLTDGSVIVYQNSSAVLYSGVNNAAVNFNGDDAVALFKVSTSSFVDIFGNIGCDPGSSWSGTNTTVNKTLVRNANVCSGVTSDDVTSCPFPTLDSEWTQYNEDDVSNLGSHTNSCTTCTDVTPTNNASAYSFSLIGCNGLRIEWNSPTANDGSLVVIKAGSDVITDPVDGTTYTANNTFGIGTDIGTNEFVIYEGNGTSVNVNGLSPNTIYYVKVFEYNGTGSCIKYRTTDEVSSNDTTTTCTECPYLSTMLINSCDQAPCTEGDNEMFFFNSMDYYVSTAASDITVNYGSSSPASTTYTDSFTSNSSAIDSMNADIGCATTFIDASSVNYIPAHSTFLVLNETVCVDAFDWSTICSSVSSEVYVLFTDDPTWTSLGQFSNNPGNPGRYFRTILEGCTIDYNYDSSLPSGDGAFAVWNSGGGNAVSYGSDGCSLPLTILPIELLFFKGTKLNYGNLLEWSTKTEINNDFFTIEKSKDALNFNELGIIKGAGNSSSLNSYQFIDDELNNITNYYRLKQTDFNGQFSYSKTIAIKNSLSPNIYYNNTTKELIYNNLLGEIKIYNTLGEIVRNFNAINSKSLLSLNKGVYIVNAISKDKIYSTKIIVQ